MAFCPGSIRLRLLDLRLLDLRDGDYGANTIRAFAAVVPYLNHCDDDADGCNVTWLRTVLTLVSVTQVMPTDAALATPAF